MTLRTKTQAMIRAKAALDYAGSAAPPIATRLPALVEEMADQLKIPRALFKVESDKVTVLVNGSQEILRIPKSVMARIDFCEQIRRLFEAISTERAKRSEK